MNNDSGKVLDFEQDADFYYDMAFKFLEEGRIPDAFPLLRKAINADPDNCRYVVLLARAYSMICRYNESNGLILELFRKGYADGECFFILGFNFLNIGDGDKAFECLDRYLSECPDGEYVQDALECMQTLAEFVQDDENTGCIVLYDVDEKLQYDMADEGSASIISGNPEHAVEILKKVNLPEVSKVRSDLALAYYLCGENDNAYNTIKEAAEAYSSDVRLLCSAAILCLEMNRDEDAKKYAGMLAALPNTDTDDGFKITDVLADLGMHEAVYEKADFYLGVFPYNEELIFKKAVAAYRMGRYDESSELLGYMIKINPDDIVAAFFLGVLNSDADPSKAGIFFSYEYDLPRAEAVRVAADLSKSMTESEAGFKRMWLGGRSFRREIKWGLDCMNNEFRFKALTMLASLHDDDEAAAVIKDFILNPEQPDEIKRQMFSVMDDNGIPGPYYAFINGHAVEVNLRKKRNGNGRKRK